MADEEDKKPADQVLYTASPEESKKMAQALADSLDIRPDNLEPSTEEENEAATLLAVTKNILGKKGAKGLEKFMSAKLSKVVAQSIEISQDDVNAVIEDLRRLKKRLILKHLGFDYRLGEISVIDDRRFAQALIPLIKDRAVAVALEYLDKEEVIKNFSEFSASDKRDMRSYLRRQYEQALKEELTELARKSAKKFAAIYFDSLVSEYVSVEGETEDQEEDES